MKQQTIWLLFLLFYSLSVELFWLPLSEKLLPLLFTFVGLHWEKSNPSIGDAIFGYILIGFLYFIPVIITAVVIRVVTRLYTGAQRVFRCNTNE